MRNGNSGSWLFYAALCLVTLSPPSVLHVQGRRVNDFDASFEFRCSEGHFLRHIISEHDNSREDRVYDLSCGSLPPVLGIPRQNDSVDTSATTTPGCSWGGYVNNFNDVQVYQCPGEGYVGGLGSYHSNRHEDRRYRFNCCQMPGTKVHNCAYTGWMNWFDEVMSYEVPSGKILRGMVSYHQRAQSDRRFQFNVCDISSD